MSNSALAKINIAAINDDILGSIIPRFYDSTSYLGGLYVRPSNKAFVSLGIVEPTIYTKRIYPTKDVYIDASKPVLNFGTSQSLITDKENMYRAFMSFSISEIPEAAVLESATLNLCKQNYTDSNSVDIYSTDDSYSEIGLTYVNAKSIGDLLYNIPLPNTTGYVNRNILDYVNTWYSDSKDISRAFNLVSTKSSTVVFGSKEGPNKPYIEVSYYLINQNVGLAETHGEIVPSILTHNEYNGSIFVESNTREMSAYGSIYVKNNSRSVSSKGETLVLFESCNYYNGEINIIANPRELSSSMNTIDPICINNRYLYGEINIVQQSSSINIPGEVIPAFDTSLDYDGAINIKTYTKSIDMVGKIKPEFSTSNEYVGEINVVREIIELYIDGSIIPEYHAVTKAYGEINIVQQSDTVEVLGEFLIHKHGETQVNGSISLAPYEGSNTYNGEISVLWNSSSEYNGEINILAISREASYNGEINIIQVSAMSEYDAEVYPTILAYATLDGITDVSDKSYQFRVYSGEILINDINVITHHGYVFIL